jgi:hypothetical protein
MGQIEALSSLGSDLTFSVSFAIARELRDQAVESDISQVELIAVMTLLTIALGRAPEGLQALIRWAGQFWRWVRRGFQKKHHAVDEQNDSDSEVGAYSTQNLLMFVSLFIDIARRISASLLVQLVANAITMREPLRASRIVSLLTITIFFVFLQSGAMIVSIKPHTN